MYLLWLQKDKKPFIKSSPSTESIQYYTEEVKDHFEVIPVTQDSSLRKYVKKIKGPNSYDRGCSYYQYTNVDVIDSGKDVIFMDKVSNIVELIIFWT